MAYRQPERRDRMHEGYTPSYLDEFLETIEPLQSSTRSTFSEISQLEDRINTTLADAQTAADEAVRRATSKVAIESVRRQYHEFIHLQASAQEFSEKKISLATTAHDTIENVIEDLDKRLVDFEAQLRKEGRWPGASQPASGRTTGKPPVTSEKVSITPRVAEVPAPLPPKAPQKSRRREAVPANPATPRAAALAAARAAAAAATATTPTADTDGDTVMQEGNAEQATPKQEAVVEGEQAVNDGTLYCICKGPSAGEMVACEGKKCKIEWFHFECVGLKEAPKGTWYCPSCASERRRKSSGRRK